MQGGKGKRLGGLPSQFVLGAQPTAQPLASMSFIFESILNLGGDRTL